LIIEARAIKVFGLKTVDVVVGEAKFN